MPQQTHQSLGVSVSHNEQKRKRHPNHKHYSYIYHGFLKPLGILIIRSLKCELAVDGPARTTYTTVCTRCQLFCSINVVQVNDGKQNNDRIIDLSYLNGACSASCCH
jgi:hypothetical protein